MTHHLHRRTPISYCGTAESAVSECHSASCYIVVVVVVVVVGSWNHWIVVSKDLRLQLLFHAIYLSFLFYFCVGGRHFVFVFLFKITLSLLT